jgi:hypothetical protein
LAMQLVIDDVQLWARHRRGLLFSMDDTLIDRAMARRFKILSNIRHKRPFQRTAAP